VFSGAPPVRICTPSPFFFPSPLRGVTDCNPTAVFGRSGRGKGASTLASRTLSRALNTSIVGEHSFEPNLVARNANRFQRAISCRFLAVASKEVRGVVTHCSGRRGEPNLELTGIVGVVRVRVLIEYGVDRREVFGTYKCLRKARNVVECGSIVHMNIDVCCGS
jgi:hypothetical protein